LAGSFRFFLKAAQAIAKVLKLGVLITAGAQETSTHVEARGSGPRLQLSHLTGWLEISRRRRTHWHSVAYSSKEKMRFQSFFMLITTQAFFVALLRSSSENVPTVVSGRAVGVLALRVVVEY
jgi:hypothetical protein